MLLINSFIVLIGMSQQPKMPVKILTSLDNNTSLTFDFDCIISNSDTEINVTLPKPTDDAHTGLLINFLNKNTGVLKVMVEDGILSFGGRSMRGFSAANGGSTFLTWNGTNWQYSSTGVTSIT
jgi:hypothetical protein